MCFGPVEEPIQEEKKVKGKRKLFAARYQPIYDDRDMVRIGLGREEPTFNADIGFNEDLDEEVFLTKKMFKILTGGAKLPKKGKVVELVLDAE